MRDATRSCDGYVNAGRGGERGGRQAGARKGEGGDVARERGMPGLAYFGG